MIKNAYLIFSLFFLISNQLFAQIKPLKFGLQFDFNKASFLQKEQIMAIKVENELHTSVNKYMDSIATSKSMCMDYTSNNTSKNNDILYLVRLYKGDYYFNERKEYSNIPILQCYLLDNLIKDTLSIWQLPIVKFREVPDKDSISHLLETELAFTKERILTATDVLFTTHFAPCESTIDYKIQKKHDKAVVFMSYQTITNNSQNTKYTTIIDNLVNNKFIMLQVNDEKYKNIDRRFIFYPTNKQTKRIEPDITIQLYLQEDKKGNYEIKGEFKGKNINLKSPYGEEMKKTITFNKKRLDSGDYTELVYELNYYMNSLYTYNILL